MFADTGAPPPLALTPRASRRTIGRMEDEEPRSCRNRNGHLNALPAARILQHKVDHLPGTLYIDGMDARIFGTEEDHYRFDAPLVGSEG